MVWTNPTTRAYGYLVTASDWNTDIVDDLNYLKGRAGAVTIEDAMTIQGDITTEGDIIPDAGTEKVGKSTDPFAEGHYSKLFAGPRYSLQRFVREIEIDWENDAFGANNVDPTESVANSSIEMGGTGQCVITVDDNASAYGYIKLLAEQNNALDNSFNASRSPYYRQEFAISQNVANTGIFLGMRQTPGQALPNYAAENFFGLVWTGTIWVFQTGDGTSQDVSGTQTINTDTRYVIEFLLLSGTSVECYLNGVLIDTLTVDPTGDLEWSVLVESDGAGGATQTHLTVGKVILQEDLS